MIGPLLTGISIALLALLLLIAWANVLGAPRLTQYATTGEGIASLLVPARNEALNLRELLPRLAELRRVEILILDDQSEDGTAELVKRWAEKSDAIDGVRGAPLPDGWLGKNWACHQLAEAASTDIFIFSDADVIPTQAAVDSTIAALSRDIDVLTALPRQHFTGWLAAAVVPIVVQLPIVTLLPLALVSRTKSAALAAGNGQWFAFRRDAYARIGGHANVRAEVVEDVALARRAKANGCRLLVALATDCLSVKMYRRSADLVDGFVKNLSHLLGGGSMAGLVTGTTLLYLVAVHPLVAVLTEGVVLALLLLVLLRITTMVLLRNPVTSLLLHPVGALASVLLAWASWNAVRRGTSTWRGRTIPPSNSASRRST